MAQKELVEAHRVAMNAQNAFLLGIAASAIAFTFHTTNDRTLTASTWMILAAAAVWAVSFAAGVAKSQKNITAIAINVVALDMQDARQKELHEKATTEFDNLSKAAGHWHKIQLWALLVGAIIFAAGHVTYMAANDPRPSETPLLPAPSQPAG